MTSIWEMSGYTAGEGCGGLKPQEKLVELRKFGRTGLEI